MGHRGRGPCPAASQVLQQRAGGTGCGVGVSGGASLAPSLPATALLRWAQGSLPLPHWRERLFNDFHRLASGKEQVSKLLVQEELCFVNMDREGRGDEWS